MAVSVLLGSVLTLTACGGSGSAAEEEDPKKESSSQESVDKAAAKDAADARIEIAAENGKSNVSINGGAKVKVTGGTLTEVTLTATAAGTKIAGTVSEDKKSWQPDAALERGTAYKLTATAKDAKGREATENSSFTTVSTANSFLGYFTPEDGSTVGVGMPVSINFDKGITDKKAVQAAIEVNSSSGQKVVGHWFNEKRLDFRPDAYWKSGSTVTLKLGLDGVEGSEGVFGVQDKSVAFTVGRSQVSVVDTKTHRMTVVRDGKTIKDVAISAGSSENPTYNGQMVISEKYKQTRMNGDSVGFEGEYDIKDVPHAMRLSTSGTFIHGNYWGADSIFGSSNTSHGCVGLNDAKGANDSGQDGAWFYDNSLLGDVVVVKNSPDETIKPHNGLNGWNMSWADWQAGSAV